MKVGITGHYSGLGKELYFRFDSIGFDLKNGFDIANPEPIVEALSECDVFINNAYDGKHQAKLFTEVEKVWAGTDKHIINISSYAVTLGKKTTYALNKLLLEETACFSLCKVSTIRPSIIDTPSVNNITNRKKISVQDVADVVEFVIRSSVHIPLIEIKLWDL